MHSAHHWLGANDSLSLVCTTLVVGIHVSRDLSLFWIPPYETTYMERYFTLLRTSLNSLGEEDYAESVDSRVFSAWNSDFIAEMLVYREAICPYIFRLGNSEKLSLG
jgi:hypothetical protein